MFSNRPNHLQFSSSSLLYLRSSGHFVVCFFARKTAFLYNLTPLENHLPDALQMEIYIITK